MRNGKPPGEYMGIKFDNHVSVGNIFTAVAVAIAVVTWGNRMESNIEKTNVSVAAIQQSDLQQNILIESIRGQTNTINTSLARIQERQDSAADNIQEIKEILRNEILSPAKRRKATTEDKL